MQGTLTTICLPDLLRTIYIERRSGELILKQVDIQKRIYFELGQIVFAASNRREDKLGEALVRHGKLTREQLEQFLSTLGRGKHLGKELVERGLLTDRELITYVTFQIIDIIYSLFTWTLGSYEFAEGEHNRAPEELKLKFSTATIILEGVRRIEDFDVIRRGLGDLNRLIAPTASPLLRLQSITLKPLERQLLELVTQPMDILRVLIAAHEQPQKVLQALYGLLSGGLLQQVATAELSATTGKFVPPDEVKRQAEAAPPVEYASPVAAPRLEDDSIQSEVEVLKARIAGQDARTILGVSAQAGADEIRDAYYKLAARFHPDKFIQSSRQVRADVDFIFANITESYNKLRAGIAAAPARPPAAPIPQQQAIAASPQTNSAYQSQSYKPPEQTPPSYALTDPRAVAPPQDYSPEGHNAPTSNFATQPRPSPPLRSSSSSLPSVDNPPPNLSTRRNASDEVEYPGYQMYSLPQRKVSSRQEGVDIEAALNDLLDYLDDRKAPLFVADSLSMLLRTTEPIHIEQTRVVETVVVWARQKANVTGRPIHEMLIGVLSSIKHAEQARVLRDFDPNLFYGSFIRELASYCPPNEAQDFLAKVGSI